MDEAGEGRIYSHCTSLLSSVMPIEPALRRLAVVKFELLPPGKNGMEKKEYKTLVVSK
jgi:hypothetical protein